MGFLRSMSLVLSLFCGAAQAYEEAPMLAEQAARGALPPVAQRLPTTPAVVEGIESPGRYGGTWRRLTRGNRDIQLDTRMGYESLVQWDRSGRRVEPGIAASWEIREGGRVYLFHLRPGLRWSDGAPCTAEDFLFTFNDCCFNPRLYPVAPAWLRIGGENARIDAPEPYTLRITFTQPYGIFLEMLAFRGTAIPMPKHYLRAYHPAYMDETTLQRQAEAAGLDLWRSLFLRKASWNENPDLPSIKPFVLRVPPPASRVIAERNPYYWKVDTQGCQLPYIDRVAYTDVQNNEVLTMKAMAGEADFQARRIDASAYPLFMGNCDKGGYRVLRDLTPNTECLYVNQHSKDAVLRPILQDRRFRIALSIAINREELIDVLYTGMAQASRGVSSPLGAYWRPEYDARYMAYDPVRARRLLDAVGLECGRGGLRHLPDGRPFRQILNVYPSEAGTSTDLWLLVADYYREVGLDFVVRVEAPYLSVLQVCAGNSDFWAYSTGGLHWILDPLWYVPWQSASYFAPAYGRYQASGGKDKLGVKPPPAFQALIDTYLALRSNPDPARRAEYAHTILGQWAEECYVIGVCRTEQLTIVNKRFRNVPEHILHDWRVMTPGYIGIEQFYFAEE